MSTIRLVLGADIRGLDIRMRDALIIAEILWNRNGQPLTITSGLEGEHSAGSLHYYGLAIDLRTRFFSESTTFALTDELRAALGGNFDVVRHSSHIHIEYDPDS